MLDSAFSRDSSSRPSSKLSKHTDKQDVKNSAKETKSSRSKSTSKSVKSSASKHTTEKTKSSSSKPKSGLPTSKLCNTATAETEQFLNSAFFKDESRVQVEESQPPAPAQSTTPDITTAFTSEHDRKMATRQLRIDTLSEVELQEQEEWAQKRLLESQACPAGWGWQRYTAPEGYSQFNGYRCYGGASTHLVSHELLAEGKNRLYQLDPFTNWAGPFDAEEVRRELVELAIGGQQLSLADQAKQLTPEQFAALLRSIFS
ncbi:hypothetical protein ONS96_011302 [Cadophora gregata f. sp. sojae]|nr:hypothetical protein ONS96_011302 [Cadophora gregata f. sp. sojae]